MIIPTTRGGSVASQWLGKHVAIALCAVSFVSVGATALGADSIFDDTWVPPAPASTQPSAPSRADAQPPAASAPSTVPVSPPAAKDPPSPAPAEPAAPTLPVARLAIPARADQVQTRKLFEEVFGAELKQHTVDSNASLATKLLEQGLAPNDTAVDRYVLLTGAARAARDACNLPVCCRAADALGASFQIDALRMKCNAVLAMKLRAPTPTATDENCVAALALVDQVIKADDLTTATHLLSAIRRIPPRGALAAEVQDRSKALDAVRSIMERVAPAIQKLKTSPDDAAANQVIGEYRCFDKGDWKEGLPLLSKAAKANLAAAAALDLACTNDPTQYAAAGDAWWNIADSETFPPRQLALRRRAARFYYFAIARGAASGIKRVLYEKRIAATPPDLSHARVISARWGGGSNWIDVTQRINDLLAAGTTVIWANPATLQGDPTPGWRKHLDISYMKYGTQKSVGVDEDQQVPTSQFTP